MEKTQKMKIRINDDMDILHARKAGRQLAEDLGFRPVDCIKVATAITELVRNCLLYAGGGFAALSTVTRDDGKIGIRILVEDSGPGIEDIDKAMKDGFSTSNGLGVGLPGVMRLMDEFEVQTEPGKGTTVKAIKWAWKPSISPSSTLP